MTMPLQGGATPHEAFPRSSFGAPPADPTIHQQGELRTPAGLVIRDGARTSERKKLALSPLPDASQKKNREASFDSLVPDSKKGIQEVAVIAGDLGFFPKTVFVTKDVPVRIFVTGASDSTLCFMMDSFEVRKQIRSKTIQEITFTPSTPGVYRFHCPVNQMEGRLVVKELISSNP